MSKFKVGDIVKVTDWEAQYSTYYRWFFDHINVVGFDIEWAIRYAFDNNLYEIDSLGESAKQYEYRILYVAGDACLITAEGRSPSSPVYLINESGLKRHLRKMTKADIEKELGYEIEIIEENKNDT